MAQRATLRPPATLTDAGEAPPIRTLPFLGVVVASFGGPLALAALYAPSILTDASASAGFVMVAAAVVFAVPLLVWLRYSRHVATPGGLYGYVVAAAGPRVGLLQAGLWIASYVLYLAYTTASIVYDTLPAVLPGIGPYQSTLEIAIPVALAATMLAGRTITLAVLGVVAAGQLVLVAVLAAVTVGHDAPASSFAVHGPVGDIATATALTALLYICGSLPLFLGGEVVRPFRTVPRAVTAGFLLTAAGVVATVFPIAANPAFTHAPIPGMSIAEVFAGHSLAVTIGIGVAVSTAGLMLVEYVALSRVLHAVTDRPLRPIIVVLAVVLVGSAPLSLINPERFYDDLLKPSLIALWLSQLVVFAVYPRFAAARRQRPLPAWTLAIGASAFAIYGVYATVAHTST
jgi:amino acid transporter